MKNLKKFEDFVEEKEISESGNSRKKIQKKKSSYIDPELSNLKARIRNKKVKL